MSSIIPQVLQAKIAARVAAVKNLDQVLEKEQRSFRLLLDQIADHEVQMAERVESGTDHKRWTTWADDRYTGMKMQLAEGERRIEKLLETINGHEVVIHDLKRQLEGTSHGTVFVAVSKAPTADGPSKLAGKTVMDIDRKPPSKNPGRKYLPKAKKKTPEEKAAAKKAAEQAKKAKDAKADKKAKKQAARAA